LDVVSFVPINLPRAIIPGSPVHALATVLSNRAATRTTYHVDHLFVGLDWAPRLIVDWSRYWCGLFSHRRADDVWKGMVCVELYTPTDDANAAGILANANAVAAGTASPARVSPSNNPSATP